MSTDEVTRRAVTADMERIFGGIAPPNASKRAVTGRPAVPPVQPKRTGKSPMLPLLALAAILLVGAMVTALILLSPADRAPPEPASTASPPSAQVARPEEPVPPVAQPTAEPAPVATPSPTETREARAATRAPESRGSADRPEAAGSALRREGASARSICRNARDMEQCLYREVRSADLRLREAYEEATDNDVPVEEMRRVRRLWNRTLERSLSDPVGTIQELDGLTARLDDAPGGSLNGPQR